MNRIIIPTGYMESGSSAVTDLLMEFEGFEAPHSSFEYVFMHCPNGVFDLEDKLLIGNNAIRSDEALHSFRLAMKELFDNPLWWPGRYKQRLSPRFMNHVDKLIDSLTLIESDNFWYHQENRSLSSIPRLSAHMACKIFLKGKVNVKKSLLYEKMMLSLPTPNEFYAACKTFLSSIFEDLGIGRSNLVLDQLLLPFNAWRIDNYFDENADCVIVDRDPRDVFIVNKYILGPIQGIPVPYPTDVSAFCTYYARMRQSEKPTDNPHVHRVHFEDLIYDYDRSVKRLVRDLCLPVGSHTAQRTLFDPAKSINNTQIFRQEAYQEEAYYIARHLEEYLYPFPSG